MHSEMIYNFTGFAKMSRCKAYAAMKIGEHNEADEGFSKTRQTLQESHTNEQSSMQVSSRC